MKPLCTALVFFLVAATGTGCSSGEKPRLHAGGSTFIDSLMKKWAREYNAEHEVELDYQSIGSGDGIRLMTSQQLDFGCTDGPMTDAELAQARSVGGEVVHVPLVLGAVVPAYNLKENDQPVRFTGALLADIFLGKIKKWNDPRLQAVQEGMVRLPNLDITVVYRSDGSGTTYIFTEYLSRVSPAWKDQVGFGTRVKFPAGAERQGNSGVAEEIQHVRGAIGYLELTYALDSELGWGSIQNKAGNFVHGGMYGVREAAAAVTDFPDDLRYSLVDQPGKDAYPISGTTWAIVYKNPPRSAKAIVNFLRWATGPGQNYVTDLNYVALPPSLLERARKQIEAISLRQGS
jgi:phosphate ABC transporter phosphate-binding protein